MYAKINTAINDIINMTTKLLCTNKALLPKTNYIVHSVTREGAATITTRRQRQTLHYITFQ